MCGIAGFIDRGIPPAGAQAGLGAMLSTLVHRGPDGEGIFHDAGTGLSMGMRRLSIIDLDGGWQPVHNEDRTVSVVFNGEIYNYVELTAELKARGHVFKTHSDTEVLVHLYEEMGEKMVDRLRGMFAFALFDAKNAKLFLARDPFGQKPLYWTSDGRGRVAFASETKALLALPWVDSALSEESFLDFVSWLSLPAPATHFKRIFSFPPGTCAMLELAGDGPARGLRPATYWRQETLGVELLQTEKEALELLHQAMDASVKIHLRADVPMGILLSGGLDSRLVTAYARIHHEGVLKSFTASFEDSGLEDEAMEANRTAFQFGIENHLVRIGPGHLLEDIGRVAHHLDQPVGDPAAFAVRRVCMEARGHVKVLLGGEGSDELFAGYEGRYAAKRSTLARTRQIRPWLRLLPAWDGRWPETRLEKLRCRASATPDAELVGMRTEGFPLDNGVLRVLNPEQLRRLLRRRAEWAAELCIPQRGAVAAAQALDLRWQLPSSLLLKSDEMSMAASIELRCPFLSREVAAVAARLPESMRLPEGGPGKWLLRRLMGQLFPESGNRPKKGFPVPLASWMRGPLREAVAGTVLASDSKVCGPLDRRALAGAWDALQQGVEAPAQTFYALWLYEVWARQIR